MPSRRLQAARTIVGAMWGFYSIMFFEVITAPKITKNIDLIDVDEYVSILIT